MLHIWTLKNILISPLILDLTFFEKNMIFLKFGLVFLVSFKKVVVWNMDTLYLRENGNQGHMKKKRFFWDTSYFLTTHYTKLHTDLGYAVQYSHAWQIYLVKSAKNHPDLKGRIVENLCKLLKILCKSWKFDSMNLLKIYVFLNCFICKNTCKQCWIHSNEIPSENWQQNWPQNVNHTQLIETRH